MVKKWKKSGRNKVFAETLLGVGILLVLGAVTVLIFPPGVKSQPHPTPHPEPKKVSADSFVMKTVPLVREKSSTTRPVRQTSGRKLEESPTTKPVRQSPIHIESMRDYEAQVLDAGGMCLVDLFSNRCPPCRMLAPKITSLAKKYAGKVLVCKVNLDELPALAGRYRISAIPTVLIIKNGKLLERLVGLRRESEYSVILDKLLSGEQ